MESMETSQSKTDKSKNEICLVGQKEEGKLFANAAVVGQVRDYAVKGLV